MKPQIQEQEHEIAQIEKMAYKLESKLRLRTKDQEQSYSLPLSTNTISIQNAPYFSLDHHAA